MILTQEDKDNYFLDIAAQISKGSTCIFCHAGAVIVDKDDNIISIGVYKGVDDVVNCTRSKKCSWYGRTGKWPETSKQHECDALYSEAFAIFNAPKDKLKGSTLYIFAYDMLKKKPKTVVPDVTMSKLIQLAGIKRIVTVKEEEYQILDGFYDSLNSWTGGEHT